MSRFPVRATAIEHTTRRAPSLDDWQTSLAQRRAQLQEALAPTAPSAPEWVMAERRQRHQERLDRELSDAPTPKLLEAARLLDRRRHPLDRSGGRRPS